MEALTTRRGVGRPSKLTDETIETLCEKLREGFTYAVACASAGVAYTTFRMWMNKGREGKSGQYVRFLDIINEAEMEARATLEARANKEAPALTILERRWPDAWAKKDRVIEQGNFNIQINVVNTDGNHSIG